jgi:tRNA threonylcarbamoyladenosine biosynthesis protein TsaE
VAWAANVPSPCIVFLHGDLGAGKTTFAQSWLRALGVTGAIKSPSYSLVERYQSPAGHALHLDLYRLSEASELHYLGLDDYLAGAVLMLVEWPERALAALPKPTLELRLHLQNDKREAVVSAPSAAN